MIALCFVFVRNAYSNEVHSTLSRFARSDAQDLRVRGFYLAYLLFNLHDELQRRPPGLYGRPDRIDVGSSVASCEFRKQNVGRSMYV